MAMASSPLRALPTAPQDPHASARKALIQGHAGLAIGILEPLIAANPDDAEARNLLCRVYSGEERDDEAVRECSAAVAAAPAEGEYYRWLARAYGGKAQHSSVFTAFVLSKHVRENFQRAVQLEPESVVALTDLGEYYVEAPSALGGGPDRASPLLPTLLRLDPAAAHWLGARIAEAGGDEATAEAEYKRAVETASTTAVANGSATNKAQAWADFASFLRKQHRDAEALTAVRSALAADTLQDGALVAAAGTLRALKTEQQLGIQMLRSYLASPHKTEEEPTFQVEVVLGKAFLLQEENDAAARQFNAALAEAPGYQPALRALARMH